jgi:hypothetical protein
MNREYDGEQVTRWENYVDGRAEQKRAGGHIVGRIIDLRGSASHREYPLRWIVGTTAICGDVEKCEE